jgi:hypothetical protein
MPRALDPVIADKIKEFGLDPKDSKNVVWDCHGTWVIYHRALEQIAAKAGITFNQPQVLEANGASKSVALCVAGTLGDKTEWSVGEAAPSNCKNSYPYAMAEKRAKDRVILKLIGLHGAAYSEEEADDFRPTNDTDGISAFDVMEEVISTTENVAELATFMTRLKDTVAKFPQKQQEELRKVYTFKKRALETFNEAAE